jgi:type II secretory pathway component PulK
VLPVVLIVLALLAVLVASFSFQIEADNSAGLAMAERLQTRLAAEAGIQQVMYMLRTDWANPNVWMSNPDRFDQALVWKPEFRLEDLGRRQPEDAVSNLRAYRYSIVADNPFDDLTLIRYGITDEASKLNLNVATEAQLLRLISPHVPEGQEPLEFVQAIIDWRDADDEPKEFGAESAYYQTLVVPYRAKNAPFETVEELLLVRGFTGLMLYGEDQNRNGLLDPNEDDGETSFPLDNADGKLDRGLYPYITVYSREFNTANDNKPRINLFAATPTLRDDLLEVFEEERIVDFIIDSTKKEGSERIESLADYLKPHIINNSSVESPLKAREAALLFDHCTLDEAPEFQGLINVTTAPLEVLNCIEGLPAEAIPTLLQKRAALVAPIASTPAWLVTEKVVTPEQYKLFAKQVTGRSRQFTVESIGFGDHTGVFSRLEAVLNMRGPLAQIVYYRDITRLGLAYPIRGKEGERDIVRQDR